VGIRARGNYRRENCELASLMFMFNYDKSDKNDLSKLKKVKFVAGCQRNVEIDQLVIKEYLTYRIYQRLTPVSFRVRLVKVNFKDVNNRMKSYTQYGFFIEDVDDLADRNKMVERYNHGFRTEQSNREHTTLVCIFQYMIGNTDWAVPVDHNIKLLSPKKDTMLLPYIVPYDFDYCGLVNASYAVPHEMLGIKNVTDRLYRGFPRTIDELRVTAKNFLDNKEAIMSIVENDPLLNKSNKKIMWRYLEDFYDEIKSDNDLYRNFLMGARQY